MESYRLSPGQRTVFGFFYKGTFVFFGVEIVRALPMQFLMDRYSLDLDRLIDIYSLVGFIFLVGCALAMEIYAARFVLYLWRAGCKREAKRAFLHLMIMHPVMGYQWFYWLEIKKRDPLSLFRP